MDAPSDDRTLHAAGLLLRPFTAADHPTLAVTFADPEVARWNPGPADGGSVEAWADARNDWSEGDHASWAVSDLSGALLGSVSVHRVDRDQLDAEVGYWTVPTARGRGVASRAVATASGYAFSVLGLRRLHLMHAVENAASCGTALRAGFAVEGMTRRSYHYGDGHWYDEHLHARLHDDPAPSTARPSLY